MDRMHPRTSQKNKTIRINILTPYLYPWLRSVPFFLIKGEMPLLAPTTVKGSDLLHPSNFSLFLLTSLTRMVEILCSRHREKKPLIYN